MNSCIVNTVLNDGGDIEPILIDPALTGGTGIFNPSLILTEKRRLLTIRRCQVTVWHTEKLKYQHSLAPIVYLNPENDISLTSSNFIMKIGDDLKTYDPVKVNMKLDVTPQWDFKGLEDPRIVEWDGKLLLCGGRRDTNPTGIGRLEITEIDPITFEEISRKRFEPPVNTYCEKNWMPVNDLPWHFVKWTNPTEVMKVDWNTGECKQTVYKTNPRFTFENFRGGSNVIDVGQLRMCIVHITRMSKSDAGKKNAKYTHCVVVWDKDWNLVSISDEFSFMNTEIEFCCGLAREGEDFIIGFGVQDNSAHLMRMKKSTMEKLVCLKID